MAESPLSNILVIKLGALGDFIQALGPMAAIRRHHGDARITLLTTAPFEDFSGASGFFDQIWTCGRPGAMDIGGWLGLRRRLRDGGFGRVYDLQTSDRSSLYARLFWPGRKPEWSGIAKGCSHPHANPKRDFMHTLERQAEQLAEAGIPHVPPPDLAWATADISRFGLAERFALLVPGGAAQGQGQIARVHDDLAGRARAQTQSTVVQDAGVAALPQVVEHQRIARVEGEPDQWAVEDLGPLAAEWVVGVEHHAL